MSKPPNSTKWWIGAVIPPFIMFGVGFLIAFNAPKNENDWTGAGFFAPIYFCLLLGCVISVVFAVVSLAKQERGCFYAVLVGLPSLCFSIYSVGAVIEGRRKAKFYAEQRAASYKREEERSTLSKQWEEKFRTNQDLITSDVFWAQQRNTERVAAIGLHWLLMDPSVVVSEKTQDYVILNFSDDYWDWRDRNSLTKADYEKIILNQKASPSLKSYARLAIESGNFSKSKWEK